MMMGPRGWSAAVAAVGIVGGLAFFGDSITPQTLPDSGGVPTNPATVRLGDPDQTVALELPATYALMASDVSRTLHEAVRTSVPEATAAFYGRVAPDGGLAVVLVAHAELGEQEDGQTVQTLLPQAVSETTAAFPGAGVQAQAVPSGDSQSVEVVVTATFEGGDVWARIRMWAEEGGRLQTRGCVCTGSACADVREQCAFRTPEHALPATTVLRGARQSLQVRDLQVGVPPSWVAVPEPDLFAIAEQERAAYPRLSELEIVGRAPGPDAEVSGSAYLQVGRWCADAHDDASRGCKLSDILDDIESSARGHAEVLGEPITVARTDSDPSEGALEIRIGTFSWERRRFVVEGGEVRETSCLCTRAGCRYVEPDCE